MAYISVMYYMPWYDFMPALLMVKKKENIIFLKYEEIFNIYQKEL